VLRPRANVRPFPAYVPKPILDDYREACLIVRLSPKASATLARRCLQGMIRNVFGVARRTLFDEIEAIKDLVAADTWDEINAVREIGNVGAHMQKDIDVIVDVDPDEADLMIRLVEDLIEEWYIAREERQQRRVKLLAAADAKRAKKPLPPVTDPLELDVSEPPDPD
jgi:hypothetical protein